MADERVAQHAVIVDPATRTQEAGVDASGHLQVDLAASSVTQTVDNAGTFAVQVDGDALTALQLIDDVVFTDDTSTHATGTTKGAGVMAAATPTDGSVAANDIGMLAMSTDRRLHTDAQIVGTDAALDVSAATVTVDLGANNDVTIEGGAVLGTDGNAGPANALSVGGTESDGTFQEVRTDTDGHLQVDVLTGGGTDSPTNPTLDTASTTDTAAGSAADLDSAEITEAEKLWQVVLSASVAFKAVVRKVENGVDDDLAVVFGKAGETVIWEPAHRDFTTHAGSSAGVDLFQAEMTNLDTSQAADLYASFLYST